MVLFFTEGSPANQPILICIHAGNSKDECRADKAAICDASQKKKLEKKNR